MNKLLLLSLITILLITPIALADGLGFSDIDVEVDGDAADDVDADGGSFDAAPGDSVEITIEVQNTFDVSTEGHKIKRINVEIEVDNFCPKGLDDEINDDASLDNLDPDTDDSATFRFYIPDCAEEDNYNLDIIVEGKDDDDGTVYKISKKLLIGLEKNPTELTLDFGELEPSTVSCDRTFETTVEVHNIGTLSEDAGLLLINNDIGVNKFDFLDLKPGKWTNEDTYFEKTYEFTLDDDVEAGEYSIRAEVEYDSNSREIKRYQTIIVEDCEEEVKEDSSEETKTITIETGTETIGEDEEADEEETSTVTLEKDNTETMFSVPILIGAIVVAVLVLILMLFMLKKK